MTEDLTPNQQNHNSAVQARTTVDLLEDGASFNNGVLVPTGEQYEEIRDTGDYVAKSTTQKVGSLSLYDRQESEAMGPIEPLIQERENQEQLKADLITTLQEYNGIFDGRIPYDQEPGKKDRFMWRERATWEDRGKRKHTNTYDFALDYSADGYGSKLESVTMDISPWDVKGDIRKLYKLNDGLTRRVKYDFEAGQIRGIQLSAQFNRKQKKVAGSWNFGAADTGHAATEQQERVQYFNNAAHALFDDGNITIDLSGPNPVIQATAHPTPIGFSVKRRAEGSIVSRYEYDPKKNSFVRTGGDSLLPPFWFFPEDNDGPGAARPTELTTGQFCKIVQGAVALVPSSIL